MQSRNPYEPPRAPVGDADAQPIQRPSTINLAFWLLIASAGFGLLALFIPELQTSWFIVAFMTAYLITFAFLIRAGKNWARIVYLAFFSLGAIGIAAHLKMLTQHGALPAVFMIVNTACQGYAAWLAFRTPGAAWFKPST